MLPHGGTEDIISLWKAGAGGTGCPGDAGKDWTRTEPRWRGFYVRRSHGGRILKVLVAGGAGFIGSHTCVELLGAGHEVIIADNFCNSKPEAIENIQRISGREVVLYRCDLRDLDALRRVFAEQSIDAVIHFAGLKSVPESVQKPQLYYENNLGSTFALCQAMTEGGCRRLVFSSSATVYGNDNPVPFREDMAVSAINPYGRTKVMIEQFLSDLSAADPLWSIYLLRYFNPIGAHPSGLLGEDPNGAPNNLLPFVSQVAAGQRPEVVVYGDDYETPDGTGIRDYVHVCDLALGHLAAMEFLTDHNGVEKINLGTGRGTSVLEIIDAYSAACGRQLPYRIEARRPGDIPVCYADTEKANRLLGWKAERGIDEMCRDSWNFAKGRYAVSA